MKKFILLFALLLAGNAYAFSPSLTIMNGAIANVSYPPTMLFAGPTPNGWTVRCKATGTPTSAVITIAGQLNSADSPSALGTITLPDSSTGTALYTFGFKGSSNDQYFGASLVMTGGVNPTITCIVGY